MRRVLPFMMISLLVSLPAAATPPAEFTVQGILRDGSGMLQSTAVTVSVSLYDAQTFGTKIAGPYTQAAVPVTNGLFTLTIADVNLPGIVASASGVWMEITAGSDVFPRQKVTTSFYALQATDSTKLGGTAASSYALKTDTAPDSLKLGGTAASGYLTTSATAFDSARLGGTAASGWQKALGTTDCGSGHYVQGVTQAGAVTCAVDQSNTYTNGSGLGLSAGTFSVDTNTIQARVSGSCPAGTAIRAIAGSGVVTCTGPKIVTVVSSKSIAPGSFAYDVIQVDCPVGYIAIGGGVDASNILTGYVSSSAPTYNGIRILGMSNGQYGPPNGWQGSVVSKDSSTITFTLMAICALQ